MAGIIFFYVKMHSTADTMLLMVGRRGITLVEVLVTIGIILVLVGLLLPSLSGASQRARVTSRTALLQSNVALISLYCADHRDRYPVAAPSVNAASYTWDSAMVRGEYAPSVRTLDPDWAYANQCSFVLSFCMLHDPAKMRRGATVPIDSAATQAASQADVAFPSLKGLIHELFQRGEANWCCVARRPAPVAFVDGSTVTASWVEFQDPADLHTENSIGYPILSTWGGYLARDR